ncbi:hypothetical protein XM38_038190 [Halomicronema hongdechloris C2206]|uniref:DUF2157 domain-containing protein n=1 Tax=Halomicronema hongdechloris C2206 TaxID=1641165 RepID=A0A1Z3HRB0_9CYAN|nr:hypothetical protein [Halomicronema hongdechloris]ASC72859.1 hypothetical protein XM38_038190 [Halomicronema hongdechloris C2206]
MVYALWQGRLAANANATSQPAWVYRGLGLALAWVVYLRGLVPAVQRLDDWWPVIATGLAVVLYRVPWHRYGWPQPPWQRLALGLPLLVLVLLPPPRLIPTLGLVAAYYGWLAWATRGWRLSYLSGGLLVWAIWVWLMQQAIDDPVSVAAPLGLWLLYVAQVDPGLRQSQRRRQRHWLRLITTWAVLLLALISPGWRGLPVGILSLAITGLGLGLRVRAFLYGGTVIFGLNAIQQLLWLNANYPFLKWILGIAIGMGLIWLAADFERRRHQWQALAQGWRQELSQWE